MTMAIDEDSANFPGGASWPAGCAAPGRRCSAARARRQMPDARRLPAGGSVAHPQALLIEIPDRRLARTRPSCSTATAASSLSTRRRRLSLRRLRRGEPALITLRMPELVEAIRRAAATQAPQRVEFFERVPLDRWFEAFVTPVTLATGGDGRSDILLMTFNDLTPLRRVEEMRADFIANASHELRTPLAALLGFIETLQGSAKEDPAARDKFLAIMQGQATRMARLIDDLLSLSRIELNAHLKPNTPVDLAPIVRQVADGLQTLARDRGRRDQGRRAGRSPGRARRPRRIDPCPGKSGGERAEIRRRRQARRRHLEPRPDARGDARRCRSQCATTVRALPPTTCRA